MENLKTPTSVQNKKKDIRKKINEQQSKKKYHEQVVSQLSFT